MTSLRPSFSFGAVLMAVALVGCAPRPAANGSASTNQPLWVATNGQPSVARSEPRASVLPTGQVLVAGGVLGTGAPTATAELYDPTTGTWSAAAAMSVPRAGHTLTARADGTVLASGGQAAVATLAEVFDGATGLWTPAAAMVSGHTNGAACLLDDGRVLVTGGPSALAEVLELDGGWSAVAALTQARAAHTATSLADGTALVAGGVSTSTSEQLDPDAGTWAARANLSRSGHTATVLPAGEVLVVGGLITTADAGPLATRLAVGTGALTPVGGLSGARVGHTATALPGGDVLVAGGQGAAAFSAARYVTALDRFVNAGCLAQPRSNHAAAPLPGGSVLLVGGLGPDGGALQSSERLDFTVGLLAQGSSCGRDCECASGSCADGVCCDADCHGGCQACSAARGAPADGTCTTLPLSSVCRAADGGCDVAEVCDGVSTACPGNAIADAGVSCRGAAGLCDLGESCDGLSTQCPADRLRDAGVLCRASAGACDLTESCDGLSAQCPPNRVIDAGVQCRTATGACDLPESCDGLAAACPADGVVFAGTVCRSSTGPCDVAEVCTGGKACPADVVRDAGVLCRAASGVCDAPDLCDGTSGGCAQRYVAAGVECRSSLGTCDLAEACTGAAPDCPTDVVQRPGLECRAAGGACDVAEVCDGFSRACPPDRLRDAGVVCRPEAGLCDVPEQCSGASAACPADAFADAGASCRPPAGDCDLGEACTGLGGACPADVFKQPGTVCRMSVGGCDVAEVCSGEASCPSDAVLPASTECRGSAGQCDPAEQCDGVTGLCPDDARAAAGTVCRPATSSCDVAEVCGAEVDCPVDVTGEDAGVCPMGCSTAAECDGGFCDGGVCQLPPSEPKRYVGWACGCAGAPDSGPGLLLVLLGGWWWTARARRARLQVPDASPGRAAPARTSAPDCAERWADRGPTPRQLVSTVVAAAVLGASAMASEPPARVVATAEPPVVSEFAVRLSGIFLRDLTAAAFGGELGAAVSLTRRFDANLALSLGRNVGGRLGVSWHPRDDGEWVRPFAQLRALVHPVPEKVVLGGGLLGGVLVPLGPGRVVAGVLFEAYAGGPPGYPVVGVYASVGYELDVYRQVEREGVKPVVAAVAAPVAEPPPVMVPPVAVEPGRPAPVADAGVEDDELPALPLPHKEARVVTRVALRDVLTFDERKVAVNSRHDAALKRTAQILTRLPQLKVVEVAGHADDGSTPEECMRLSLRRSQSVVEALVKLGIEPERLLTKGYGQSRAVVPTTGPARKREQNRRVDFSVLEQTGLTP